MPKIIINRNLASRIALIGMASASCAASPANAQGAAAGQTSADESTAVAPDTNDIIVTAQRRAQTALKVPLSLTALDTQALETRQVEGVQDLQFVAPGIRAGHQNGAVRVFIRGIGLNSFASGADPSIAFYIGGAYVGRPTAQGNSFYDVERIEVLRGPQGILYGRNATGGALNVITQAPARVFEGYANLTVGNYDLYELEGAINAPLSANGDLRARLSTHIVDRGGYGRDITRDHDINNAKTQSVRAQLQYENGTGTDIRLIGEYHHENDYDYYTMGFGAYPGYTLLGVTGVTNPAGDLLKGIDVHGGQDTASALEGKTNIREGYNVTLNAKFELADRLILNSVSNYRSWDRFNASNSDGTSAGLGSTYYDENSKQWSQEFILNWSKGPFDVVAGTSYYHEKIVNHVLVPFLQFYSDTSTFDYKPDGYMKIDAFAAYSQATYSVSSRFRLTAGGRWSTERRDNVSTFTFGPNTTDVSGKKRWSDFTPKFGAELDIGPSSMLYASYTQGFKSGTFNIGQVNPAINPEKITAYEFGLKSRLFNNMLDLTAAYFHYDYTDLQVNKIIAISTVTTNAATAKVDGVEFAATLRPARGLRLDGSFNYLDARFGKFFSANPLYPGGPNTPAFAIWQAANPNARTPVFGGVGGVEQDLSGYQLPGSPKYSATGGIEYDYDLGNGGVLTARGDISWSSRIHFSEFNDNHLSQAPVTKINALLRYDSGSFWNLSIWGKNLTNEYIKSNELITIALWGYPRYGAIEPPRTYGATVGLKF